MSEFYNNPNGRDGMTSRCKLCTNAANKEYHKVRAAKRVADRAAKVAEETKCGTVKSCSKCGETKPMSAFNEHKTARYGKHPMCKECRAISRKQNADSTAVSRKAYRDANKDHVRLQAQAYHREHAKELYNRAKKYKAEYREKNKAKISDGLKAWKAANINRVRENQRKWRKAHPAEMAARRSSEQGRRRGASGKHTASEVAALLGLQKGRCAVCRDKLNAKFHKDHIIPISAGGPNDIKNIQLLCPPCNLAKHSKHPIDFMQSRGFLL
jgi:5-methylcytosine-specific restriction endonuclease McrA